MLECKKECVPLLVSLFENMKKWFSILLLMMANILILAHAVVPHHHHNKMFVAFVNVLDDDARDLLNHEHGVVLNAALLYDRKI